MKFLKNAHIDATFLTIYYVFGVKWICYNNFWQWDSYHHPTLFPWSFDVLQKNAILGGAATGALVSAASSNKRDKIAVDAITGAAIARAAEFINYLTWTNKVGCVITLSLCCVIILMQLLIRCASQLSVT